VGVDQPPVRSGRDPVGVHGGTARRCLHRTHRPAARRRC
jgi:hypothetical protein